MLEKANRLRQRVDILKTTQSGQRINSGSLTGFFLKVDNNDQPKFGYIVSRRIGGSVDRHRVTRQLRHLSYPWVGKLPKTTYLVIRPNTKIEKYESDFNKLLEKIILKSNGSKEVIEKVLF